MTTASIVDSHCHLDFPDFDDDRAAVLARAREAGVGTMLTISIKASRAEAVIALAESAPDIFCTIGTHPHEADSEPPLSGEALAELAAHPKVVGIGETGLDNFHKHSTPEAQARSFRAHIDAARRTQLPLIVHTREADDETADILEEEMGKGAFPGLIHCFTAGADLARRVLDLGFYISISGVVTFKNAEALREVVKNVPRDRLLVETDAPFLAPVPHRGRRNEPSFVAHTAAALGELHGLNAEDMAAATCDNFFRLFTKAKRP